MKSRGTRPKQVTRKQTQLSFETLESREMLTTWYVDGLDGDGPGGSNFNDGQSEATALQTISRAAVRARPGDTILIRGGTYREEVTINFSGSDGAPIVYQAYPGEEVIVSGADVVTGWTPAPGVGPDVWVANVNWNANNDRDANTLFVNGELKHEARQGAENDILDIDDWGLLDRNNLPDFSTTFQANELIGFPDDHFNGAKIKFHVSDFSFNTKTIADFDGTTGTITFDSAIGLSTQKQDNGFYIYDTINALDKPGEWYKDTGNNLYYQAEPGQDPNNLDIEFKRRDHGFNVSNRDHIHIVGINFRGVSIDTDSNTDYNVYAGNQFYAYDKDNFGRFYVTGDYNVVRDNEFSHVWGAFLDVGGVRNEVVNNYAHDIGFNATSRAINAASAEELLVSHNTISKFARSFMDGYPTRSEIAYNVFENGGLLSWDTGVFDSDGSNGDSSYSIFHHNVFRNESVRGIYRSFYGRNNNAVVHHNVVYDFDSGPRTAFVTAGTEFRQAYHNTIVTDFDSKPVGSLEAREAVGTRYNNNIQISLEVMEALGIDGRGNYNYATNLSDFNNPTAGDYSLDNSSAAIDTGILIPGINDGYLGDAPDPGAFESGRAPWVAGHNFATPPDPDYSWISLPGANQYFNGQFRDGTGDWTVVSGSPDSRDRNSWNLQQSAASLTGTRRTDSVEFKPGDAISRSFTDLKPNTTYTLATGVRLANLVAEAGDYTRSSTAVTTGAHRNEEYVTGLASGQWARINNVDFGDPGQYSQIEVLHITDPNNFGVSVDDVGIEIRLDDPVTGELIVDYDSLYDGIEDDRWRANITSLMTDFSGNRVRDAYIKVTGANAANLAVGSFRLLKRGAPADDRLTINISSNGAPTQIASLGEETWQAGYEEIVFTTGPAANEAHVEFANNGRLNAYLDRIYLIEGYSTRGSDPIDLSTGARAFKSTSATTGELVPGLTDGSNATETVAGNHPGSWVHVDLGSTKAIHSIRLLPAASQPNSLSNFRVSVWSTDPDRGGTVLWSQDYFTNGQSLDANEVLQIQSDIFGQDSDYRLGETRGRFVRVESLSNIPGNQQIALGELKIEGYDINNLAATDGTASQSSTAGAQTAGLATDNNSNTYSETLASDTGSWWQTRLPQPFSIGQIEIENRDDALFSDLSHFTVSVWDEDPAAGGSKVWEKEYFSTGSVGQGETFLIDGSETSDTSSRRLASVHTGRLVRIELTGPGGKNNNGNGRLSLADVRVASSDTAPPIANVAQRQGVATQSSDFYGDASPINTRLAFAQQAIDGIVLPLDNFTATLRESGAWWQVDLQEETPIEQIVLYNRGSAGTRLTNFDVTVWDDDPDSGGTQLWSRTYNYSSSAPAYSTGTTIGEGGALIIDGSDTSSGTRLDDLNGARYVRVQLNGSNILSLVEAQVWTASQSLNFDNVATELDFDFGTESSPVQGGWIGVTPNTYGDAWWFGNVSSDYQPTIIGNILNRDFVTSTEEATLNLRLENGLYDVTLNMGDGEASRDNMMVWAESQLISADIDSPAGQFSYVDETGANANQTSFQITVSDGELNLRFDDSGDAPGAAVGWAINSLSLSRLSTPVTLPGDYNADNVVDAADYTVWRDNLGSNTQLPNDETPGEVTQADYVVWKNNFGQIYIPPNLHSREFAGIELAANSGADFFDNVTLQFEPLSGGASSTIFADDFSGYNGTNLDDPALDGGWDDISGGGLEYKPNEGVNGAAKGGGVSRNLSSAFNTSSITEEGIFTLTMSARIRGSFFSETSLVDSSGIPLLTFGNPVTGSGTGFDVVNGTNQVLLQGNGVSSEATVSDTSHKYFDVRLVYNTSTREGTLEVGPGTNSSLPNGPYELVGSFQNLASTTLSSSLAATPAAIGISEELVLPASASVDKGGIVLLPVASSLSRDTAMAQEANQTVSSAEGDELLLLLADNLASSNQTSSDPTNEKSAASDPNDSSAVGQEDAETLELALAGI